MRLSVVFELLLVFLFLAFAAARVIDPAKETKNVAKANKKTTVLRQGPPNRYCACTSRMCNCCRDFSLPVVPLKGPGCASIMYVQRDTMMVTMSFGDRVLSNTTITGKTPKPICMSLPGGISQFCGRIYGISRKGDQFRACLGLELRALDDIEAALRVSCFKFGPKGVRLESAPPVPAETGGKDPEEDDDDDYDLDDDDDDDLIGFGVDDDDDGGSSEDNEVDSDSVDYTGFSVLGEDLLGTFFSDDSGSSNAKKKKPSKKTAKPQIVVPKVSTTTRKPILPNRRRSTIRPLLSVTKRPTINRITKKPTAAISVSRPQIIQRPSVVVSPLATIQSTFPSVSPTVVTKNDLNKGITVKTTTTTEPSLTTTQIITSMQSEEHEKLQPVSQKLSQETTYVTEEPITFTIPTQKVDVKNEIKLPQTDLAKLEAVAAIAQQDVTSGVISSSSYTSQETEKPTDAVTVKYEKVTPSYATTLSYISDNTEKISSIKFVPTTVVTSSPSAEVTQDEMTNNESEIDSDSEENGIKNKVAIIQQISTTLSDVNKHVMNTEQTFDTNVSEKNTAHKKPNATVILKKQPAKKPEKEEDEEENDEEEEEEEDLIEGVLSDDDDSGNEEAEENDVTSNQTSDNKVSNDEEEDDDDDDEDDILGETIETNTKVRPTKVTIKKPASDDSDAEDEEDEGDILDVLGDDDDEEESDDDDEDEDDDDEEETDKNKKKPTSQATTNNVKKPTTQATTNKVKKPTTQQVVQTKQPVPVSTIPTEKVTERITIYKEPTEKVTEKVIIYQEPENKIPNKIFIYKDPTNLITTKTTEKVIFYREPTQQPVTEKFIIYKEPENKITEKPSYIINDDKSDEYNSDESEKVESDDENSDEEDLEDDSDSEKHMLVASIVKPGFSNKYAEEHDLTENDDLDIEDAEEDGNDFEEDRKMKGTQKKPLNNKKKAEVSVSKPKVLTLSDLIGQRKRFYDNSDHNKPISTSRTHRRMNLDRFLQV